MIEKRNLQTGGLIDQGDIFKDITLFRNISIDNDTFNSPSYTFNYVIVLSQTCDLARIYDDNPNSVLSVLVAPIFFLEDFKRGEYLSFLGLKTPELKKERALMPYKNGEKPRFYILSLDQDSRMSNELIDSFVIDFKYFFTVDVSQFNQEKYVTSVKSFYREAISHNFASYLSRIGIPTECESQKEIKCESN